MIGADGFVCTGHGSVGNKMFADCGNQPVNRGDVDRRPRSDVKPDFKKTENGIADLIKSFPEQVQRSVYQATHFTRFNMLHEYGVKSSLQQERYIIRSFQHNRFRIAAIAYFLQTRQLLYPVPANG